MESDSTLVLAVQAGDLEAYSELFRRHYPDVQRACARRMACPLEAEEIAQAAFVRALERIGQCRGDRQFGGWVQIIARHLCVDALRARSRVVPTETPMSEDHADANEPHDSLFDRERTMQVRRALESLPPRQRQAVTARAQGTGPSEIADDLGLSVGAVDSLILRGRRKLAVAFQRVAGEGGATATVTSARSAAALLAVLSIGSTRLLGGVAAAAEAGRELVAPVATGVAGAVMSVAVALTGTGPSTTPEPANVPSARPPAVVVSVPVPEPLGAFPDPSAASGSTVAADGTGPAGAVAQNPSGGAVAVDSSPLPGATPSTAAPATPTATGTDGTPLPPGPVAPPVVPPVTEVVDATHPVVTDVVDTVDHTLDAVTDLLPK
jgi:RNA polymerase sigma-70 factor (ECF subfamily)